MNHRTARERAGGRSSESMRRPLLACAVVACIVAGCSSGPSAAVRGRRVCAAYEKFVDTDYSGGPLPAHLAAAEHALLAALHADHHRSLDVAARGVVDGELSLPLLQHGESLDRYNQVVASLPKEIKNRIDAVGPDDRVVESQCDKLGRHVNA
jgi:hypothetical protein